jgi:DNA modification methylase
VELYKKLMDLSFLPGEEVLDPCAGSGTVFRAAKLAGLRATGIELSPTYAAAIRVMLSEGMQ